MISNFMAATQYHTNPVMKKPYLLILMMTIMTACGYSQDVIRLQSCSNDMISKQADSLKNLYGKDGYVLLKEASINMESEFEMPVIVPLTQGSWYQFVFIGDYSSRLHAWRQRRRCVLQQGRIREGRGVGPGMQPGLRSARRRVAARLERARA